MIAITIVKFIGILFVTMIWLFFYYRERKWWILCISCLGLFSAVVQFVPIPFRYRDLIAGGYIIFVIIISSMLHGIGYWSKNGIK